MARTNPSGDLVFPQDPIIYKTPDQKVDVRITVFGQEYHVHSVILKLYSNFFRKFLDLPKKDEPRVHAQFKYEYAAVMDADGEWGLEPVSAEAQDTPPNEAQVANWNEKIKDDRTLYTEALAFHNVLNAMYHRPITVESFYEFQDTVRLADFYCALPILSASIDTLLANLIVPPGWKTHDISRDRRTVIGKWMQYHGPEMLIMANRLRHKALFKDALVFVVAMWQSSSRIFDETQDETWNWTKKLEDHPKVVELIEYSLAHLMELHANLSTKLRREAATCPLISQTVNDIEKDLRANDFEYESRKTLETARFWQMFREKLHEAVERRLIPGADRWKWRSFGEEMMELLKCELVLVDEMEENLERNLFWCTVVEEGCFPWEGEGEEKIDW